MSSSSGPQSSVQWVREGLRFLRYGYQVVPIEPTSGVPGEVEDPVVQHLGAQPLVDPQSEAASTPSALRALGEQFEEARIGAVTGRASDLLAVELKKGRADDPQFDERIRSFADGAARLVSASREYILFPFPAVEWSLPAITEKNAAVLHGEGSVIFLPGAGVTWEDQGIEAEGTVPRREERRQNARGILTLFGLEEALAPREDPQEAAGDTEAAGQASCSLHLSVSSSPADDSSPGEPPRSLFRSGEALRDTTEPGRGLNLPWTVPEGLSVLTGRPKTAGKSSWVVNLAAHLGAGAPFLGYENAPSTVVLLADTAPANFREQLSALDVEGRDDGLSRLHVLHPSDVKQQDWLSTLLQTYEYATAIEADLVIVDCLDCYVRLKGGPAPTESEDVAHMLTAESPSHCPVLAVKSTTCAPGEPIAQTVERLGLLGISADAVLRLDNVSTDSFPCLRRLVTVSRRGSVSQTHLCALRSGRYVRVRREDLAGLTVQDLQGPPGRSGREGALPARADSGLLS